MARKPQSSAKTNPRNARLQTFYSRSAVCALCKVHEEQLKLWESEELIRPSAFVKRNNTDVALYDEQTLRRIRLIVTLSQELEVNLPGISIILHLLDRLSS